MDATIHYIAFLFAIAAIITLIRLISEIKKYRTADNLLDKHHHQIIVCIKIVILLGFTGLFYLLLNF